MAIAFCPGARDGKDKRLGEPKLKLTVFRTTIAPHDAYVALVEGAPFVAHMSRSASETCASVFFRYTSPWPRSQRQREI